MSGNWKDGNCGESMDGEVKKSIFGASTEGFSIQLFVRFDLDLRIWRIH